MATFHITAHVGRRRQWTEMAETPATALAAVEKFRDMGAEQIHVSDDHHHYTQQDLKELVDAQRS